MYATAAARVVGGEDAPGRATRQAIVDQRLRFSAHRQDGQIDGIAPFQCRDRDSP